MLAFAFATAGMFALSGSVSSAVVRPSLQPGELCPGVTTPAPPPGSPEYDDFRIRFHGRFKSEQEANWAWQVYSAVKSSKSTVVIGRLTDTKPYIGKPGYCVLSDLPNWTVSVNDVFVYGGTDRSSGFLLVSQPPVEIMSAPDLIDRQMVESDRETNWRVVYNHEIHVMTSTGKYKLPKELKPPVRVAAAGKTIGDLSGDWVFDLTYTGGHVFSSVWDLQLSGSAKGPWRGTAAIEPGPGAPPGTKMSCTVTPAADRKLAISCGGPGYCPGVAVAAGFAAKCSGYAWELRRK